ncbi:MarR family transcriptional regulator [Corynebacterium callunae]|uniref:MarR family winged helix-turn-helix transcriptional regulator n=1 Tax=Corynebacterium callunae TaxID=1721 RepID=UPI00398197E1
MLSKKTSGKKTQPATADVAAMPPVAGTVEAPGAGIARGPEAGLPQTPAPTATRLVEALEHSAHLVSYDFDSTLHRPQHSTWAAFRVLSIIGQHGPLSPAHVAQLSGMSNSALSNILKPLLKLEFVDQQTAATDKRSKLLSITPTGANYLAEMAPKQQELEEQWANELTPIEQDLLISLLNKLLAGSRATLSRENHTS